ncbi:MAG: ceramidase domain-containing protein [Pseudomonadota bacterium]
MEWTRQIDIYCERLDASYWAEPINALTNAAFLFVAAFMAYRLRETASPIAWGLVFILAGIGVGSFLFHTHAQSWAALADVGAIALFILLYLFAASRDYLGLSPIWSGLSVLAFFPFAALLTPVFAHVPLLGVSASYLPVALLIAIYGVALLKRHPSTARGLLIGVAILMISITLRSLDEQLCTQIPIGTHFAWHILNAIMLGWMIEVYRRHMLARGDARG